MEGYRVFLRREAEKHLEELGEDPRLFEEFSLEELKEELRKREIRLKEEAEKK